MSLTDSHVALNTNAFTSPFQLLGITLASFFCFAYIANRIENNIIGKIYAFIGEKSFYIMGLHFVGFKLCSLFLTTITGTPFETWYLTTPNLGTNYVHVFIYFSFGILFPLIVALILKQLKKLLRI